MYLQVFLIKGIKAEFRIDNELSSVSLNNRLTEQAHF